LRLLVGSTKAHEDHRVASGSTIPPAASDAEEACSDQHCATQLQELLAIKLLPDKRISTLHHVLLSQPGEPKETGAISRPAIG
jgi:hypothetical protein